VRELRGDIETKQKLAVSRLAGLREGKTRVHQEAQLTHTDV
jgi:hypothetical protein